MSRPIPAWLAKILDLLIPLFILTPLLWALLPGGLPSTADGVAHFTRISEIVLAWRDGIWLPSWAPDLGFGYGIPLFVFSPPLPYWIGAAYNMLEFAPEVAYKALLVTILYIGASGTYRFGKALLGVWAGIVAAAAFIYAPNQLFTLFVQGNAPQLFGWCLLPWALWATLQIYRAPRSRQQWLFALVLALVVGITLITHNVVSLIMAPTVALLTFLLSLATSRWRALWMTAAGGIIGVALGAWFAVPAVLEAPFVSTGAMATFDYHGQFVPLAELLAWPLRLDAGAINPYIPRTLGLPEVLVAGIGVLLLVVWAFMRGRRVAGARPGDSRSARPSVDSRIFWVTALFMSLFTLFCAWMTTQSSVRLWEVLPFLNLFQFPTRWVGFAGLGLAWLAAMAVGLMPRRLQPVCAGILCLFLIGPALVYLYPDKTPPGTHTISPHDVVRYEVKSGATGTTSYGEYNPRWAPHPLPPSPMTDDYLAKRPVDRLKDVLPAGSSHRVLQVDAQRQLYEITLTSPATVSINVLYFPGWQAMVNQKLVAIWPQEKTGLITLALPAGKSALDLIFGPTPLRRVMGWISGVAWILFLIGGLFVLVIGGRGDVSAVTPASEVGVAAVVTASTICLLLVLQIVGKDWFQLESPADKALAAPLQRHEDVGDHFRLLGQNVVPSTIRAGATLPVVAYWRALVEMDENYAVMVRLVDVGGGQTLVEAQQSNPDDIPTSGWATGLYVRNEWQLPIPADALPMQYALRIGFRDPNSGALLPTKEGDTLELGRLWVLPNTAPKPATGPHVRFGPAIELLGAKTEGGAVTFYWRANQAVSEDDRIFIHLLDAQGKMVGQLDGLPFDNRYPVSSWMPGQIIEDRRDMAASGVDPAQIQTITVGLYNSATQQRLTAIDDSGKTLPDNSLTVEWPAQKQN